jgi:pimeloyl-ACP methyl ester carboxylesterase
MIIPDRLFGRKIIIGVHGMQNKPAPGLFEKWWKASISEGLAHSGRAGLSFAFEQVYWADCIYAKPQGQEETDRKGPFFLDEPYVPGHGEGNQDLAPVGTRKKLAEILEDRILDPAYEGRSPGFLKDLAEFSKKFLFKELEIYFRGQCLEGPDFGKIAREVIASRLAESLWKHRGKSILLAAHSMGSIIAYDVLARLVPEVKVHTLITLGSPLGMSAVMHEFFAARGEPFRDHAKLPAPAQLTRGWFNFADPNDTVADKCDFARKYLKNPRGVGPVDSVIHNSYEFEGRRNPHNLFGYLRAPEISRIIRDFLEERNNVFSAGIGAIRGFLKRKTAPGPGDQPARK